MPTGAEVRQALLETINRHGDHLQVTTVLNETAQALRVRFGQYPEQAILTQFYDLFRTGQLSWGYNLSNPVAPWCHLTDHGRRLLRALSRDPANPDGYLAFLQEHTTLSPRSTSYVQEALRTYNSDCPRACAVMIGCAAESELLLLRDAVLRRYDAVSVPHPKKLLDWQAKRVLDGVYAVLDAHKASMPKAERDAFESYWSAFAHLIRTTRNDAGHPSDLATLTEETVHAALLMFPELASLSQRLAAWADTSLVPT